MLSVSICMAEMELQYLSYGEGHNPSFAMGFRSATNCLSS